jgi:glutamate carboxypeptidase
MPPVESMLADLAELVTCESPSSDREAVARSAEAVAELGHRLLGAEAERIVLDGRTHLRWRFGGSDPVLLLGHHDTVWPIGSLVEHPWRVVDGAAYGPGCFDMKAGIVQMFHALASLDDLEGVTVLVTGDEELGAISSRALIEAEARRSSAALVLEGSADDGGLKTGRKGIAHYEVRVFGRAAHAGLEPWIGANAAVEVAHQVLALAALDRGPDGGTVTPTVLAAGTASNTVPALASLHVDVRVPDQAERDRIEAAIHGLAPQVDGTRIEVVAGPNHPPLEPSASAELYTLAAEIGAELGLGRLGAARVGGASDGNLTAGVGTPTLDGLGAVGGGAHAPGERVVVAEMPRRAALVAALVTRLR